MSSPNEKKVMKAIQSSIVAASQAKLDIDGCTDDEIASLTARVRELIAAVTGELGNLVVAQGSTLGGLANG
ncbi:MAG TPA: hypothetical protein VH352_10920 [Pseudonocardiaceae bacterium]|nr:hypothetical protein [Pseudonocardiaceae bacterium]